MSDGVIDAARRLVVAADSGELAGLCERTKVRLMVVFGSTVHGAGEPRDVDVAVSFERDAAADVLGLLDALYDLTGFEGFDVLDLDRAGPVARERALVGGQLLHQASEGLFANLQIAAMMERMDTDEMRRVELELMAR